MQHPLAVVKRNWCDFVVFTVDHSTSSRSIAIVRVPYDRDFWSAHFLKLWRFYYEVVVPNIVASAVECAAAEAIADVTDGDEI